MTQNNNTENRKLMAPELYSGYKEDFFSLVECLVYNVLIVLYIKTHFSLLLYFMMIILTMFISVTVKTVLRKQTHRSESADEIIDNKDPQWEPVTYEIINAVRDHYNKMIKLRKRSPVHICTQAFNYLPFAVVIFRFRITDIPILIVLLYYIVSRIYNQHKIDSRSDNIYRTAEYCSFNVNIERFSQSSSEVYYSIINKGKKYIYICSCREGGMIRKAYVISDADSSYILPLFDDMSYAGTKL